MPLVRSKIRVVCGTASRSLAGHDEITSGDYRQHSVSRRNVIIGQVTCQECNQYPQVGVLPANLACKKVPVYRQKLKTTKDRRSLHNVANGEVLRYLVEMVHNAGYYPLALGAVYTGLA